jgi:hypothetical protein
LLGCCGESINRKGHQGTAIQQRLGDPRSHALSAIAAPTGFPLRPWRPWQ